LFSHGKCSPSFEFWLKNRTKETKMNPSSVASRLTIVLLVCFKSSKILNLICDCQKWLGSFIAPKQSFIWRIVE
jgi:hypothetical protein